MRFSGSIRLLIFSLIIAIGTTLTLPYLALGAARSFGRTGRFKTPQIHRQQSFLGSFHDFHSSGRFRAPGFHRQDFFSHPFNGFGFVGGVDGFSEQPIIIIQQFQPAPNKERREPATNRVYVQPRWVDGGYGVQVLEPGYWTDPKVGGH
jgi:hypothetical protein